MAVFKCKMCGATLDIANGINIVECEYCGSKQTLPRLDDEKRANLYDRANHFRRNNEFDKATAIFEQILNEDKTDAEAYWSLVLCKYGVEYVEDPVSRKRIPTIHRAQYTSIFDDENYKSALEYADGAQKEVYQAEAKALNEIQKGILEISQNEEPFDVFICYKETDSNGRRTPDSVLANELYHELTQEGFKVFFARITLEDKLGSAYEPYIFSALNSAKVMVVLGTKSEYFNAVWVRNEWSRFLSLIKGGAQKTLIPAYKDMDAYDLPDEFAHLQAQDMSKLGFMQDLIRGIRKIAKSEDKPFSTKDSSVVKSDSTESLLKRGFWYLNECDWTPAKEYFDKVLDIDPENEQAYLGNLMVDFNVSELEKLGDLSHGGVHISNILSNKNYIRLLKFGTEKTVGKIKQIIENRADAMLGKIDMELLQTANEGKLLNIYENLNQISLVKDVSKYYLALAQRYVKIAPLKFEIIELSDEKVTYQLETNALTEVIYRVPSSEWKSLNEVYQSRFTVDFLVEKLMNKYWKDNDLFMRLIRPDDDILVQIENTATIYGDSKEISKKIKERKEIIETFISKIRNCADHCINPDLSAEFKEKLKNACNEAIYQHGKRMAKDYSSEAIMLFEFFETTYKDSDKILTNLKKKEKNANRIVVVYLILLVAVFVGIIAGVVSCFIK